ncbi:DUF2531 family protein [Buttiauxella sp. B2]|uniref:HofP DNA utilization family protein n=1 Tax=Buttiauxella sp. B2 TaxID=2587812 RepID=UPI00111FB8B8|nr:HofP DNA utilization family protein [Buttiauxella sp. B2]TNV20375.1 DUF2531 family protein [Buttiauxella sp. B2]
MSRSIWIGLLIAASSVRAMPPNPFQPQISPCEKLAEQLAGWALQGVVSSSTTSTALMLSPQGTWKRIKAGSELFPGVHIESVGAGFVAAKLVSVCQPSSYRWDIKGTTYAMDSSIASGARSTIHKPGR